MDGEAQFLVFVVQKINDEATAFLPGGLILNVGSNLLKDPADSETKS